MTAISMSRRQALLGTAAMAGTATLGALPMPKALAKAPLAKDQAPYFYRFSHGKMQATVVSDGILPLGDPSASFLGSSKEEIGKMLSDSFLSPTNVVLEQNILVLNTGDKLVLFDTGMGSSQMFGPTPGKLLASLKAAGIDPKDIDAVVATHAHCDHVWGIMADDGSRNFPNAQIYISQADFDFWTDEAKLAMKDPAYMKPFVEGAQEPAAQPGPHGVLQGRAGVPSRHPGTRRTRPHDRAHLLHDYLRRQIARRRRRLDAPPGDPAGEAWRRTASRSSPIISRGPASATWPSRARVSVTSRRRCR